MILLHGDSGSGKSRALRDLESRPPAGWLCVYAPVPTLELEDLARWCLDRLGAPASPDPLAALVAQTAGNKLLLLVDDADRLPLATALGLRKLERDSRGRLGLVAACAPENLRASAILALGVATEICRLSGDSGAAFAQVADGIRSSLAPAAGAPARVAVSAAAANPPGSAVSAPAAKPARAVQPPRAQEQPRPSTIAPITASPEAANPQRSPPPPLQPAPSTSPAPAESEPRRGRTVPLWMAAAAAAIAFLIPTAFVSGFVLGRSAGPADVAVAAEPPAPAALPSVALPPPAATAPQAEAAPVSESEQRPVAVAVSSEAMAERQSLPAIAATPAPATLAERAEEPTSRAVREPRVPKPRADEGFGAPRLLGVGPPSEGS